MNLAVRSARWTVLAVAPALLVGLHPVPENQVDRSPPPRTEEVHPSFPGVRLLALGDDQLLLWEVHGRAQLRRSDGTWTREFRLPVERILNAAVDGSGYLLAGVLPSGGPAVVLMATSGGELTRWKLVGDGAYAVVSDANGRRAATRAGTLALRPDGTTGELAPYPGDNRFQHGHLPTVLNHNGATVLCYPSDSSMAHHARGSCERLGTPGWRFEGEFIEPPFACGAWIVTKSRAPSKGGTRVTELATWSFATGTIEGRSRHSVLPVTACAESDMMVIGERQLRLVRLPTFELAWRGQLNATLPVQDLAVTKSLFAFRRDESLDVVVLPRPDAPLRGAPWDGKRDR